MNKSETYHTLVVKPRQPHKKSALLKPYRFLQLYQNFPSPCIISRTQSKLTGVTNTYRSSINGAKNPDSPNSNRLTIKTAGYLSASKARSLSIDSPKNLQHKNPPISD